MFQKNKTQETTENVSFGWALTWMDCSIWVVASLWGLREEQAGALEATTISTTASILGGGQVFSTGRCDGGQVPSLSTLRTVPGQPLPRSAGSYCACSRSAGRRSSLPVLGSFHLPPVHPPLLSLSPSTRLCPPWSMRPRVTLLSMSRPRQRTQAKETVEGWRSEVAEGVQKLVPRLQKFIQVEVDYVEKQTHILEHSMCEVHAVYCSLEVSYAFQLIAILVGVGTSLVMNPGRCLFEPISRFYENKKRETTEIGDTLGSSPVAMDSGKASAHNLREDGHRGGATRRGGLRYNYLS
ncbi:hypothetical protein AAG570_002705 [Ranatra chinensis]|uniref:Uncharacterized protein n=1 Tax=Ranatra chinensis TaxID=642074 RepID=A0ABD0YWS6_9HEMI